MQPLRFRSAAATLPDIDVSTAWLACPDRQDLLLWAVRAWAMGRRDGSDVACRVRAAFEARGAGEAFVALRELLAIAWRSASRPLSLAPPGVAQPSPDERCLLAAIRHAQDGDLDACRWSLAVLLCPLGARAAVLPAWGLARALAGLEAVGERGEAAGPPAGPLILVR